VPQRSLAEIKRKLAHEEYVDVLQTLSREKVELADFLELETQIDFDQAMSLIEMLCTEILPGYQGIGKLRAFRDEIRDRLKMRAMHDANKEHNDDPNG